MNENLVKYYVLKCACIHDWMRGDKDEKGCLFMSEATFEYF